MLFSELFYDFSVGITRVELILSSPPGLLCHFGFCTRKYFYFRFSFGMLTEMRVRRGDSRLTSQSRKKTKKHHVHSDELTFARIGGQL
jgi:hypothetical protein